MNHYLNNLWTDIEDIQAATVCGGQVATPAPNTPTAPSTPSISNAPKVPEFNYPLRLRISGSADLALALQADLDLKIDVGVQKGT